MDADAITFAVPEALFEQLSAWLGLEVETAGVLLLRSGNNGALLLAQELIPVPDEAYRERTRVRLDIASPGYVPALRTAQGGDQIACFVHSHPGGIPDPSALDDEVDSELRRLFPARTRQPLYVSVIIGGTPDRPSLSGRVYRVGQDEHREVTRFRIVGKRLRMQLRGEALPEVSLADFDRQVRAFGEEGQRLLAGLRVGVVGAGGTGSAVVEMLTRLGVGEILVADDEELTATNLRRIHESTSADVGQPKTEIAARLAGQLQGGTRVATIDARVTKEEIARRFTECDVIFGCTDDHAGRAVLSRIAYWFLIPIIDMGVVVDTHVDIVDGVYGRITVVGPELPCLVCLGVVDPVQVRNDTLPPDERDRLAAEGYAPGLGEPDPSVVAYTTAIAALAVSELLNRLFGLGGEQTMPSGLLLRVHQRKMSATTGASNPGHYCADPTHWGRGDEAPFLGQTW